MSFANPRWLECYRCIDFIEVNIPTVPDERFQRGGRNGRRIGNGWGGRSGSSLAFQDKESHRERGTGTMHCTSAGLDFEVWGKRIKKGRAAMDVGLARSVVCLESKMLSSFSWLLLGHSANMHQCGIAAACQAQRFAELAPSS